MPKKNQILDTAKFVCSQAKIDSRSSFFSFSFPSYVAHGSFQEAGKRV
jgi:hypothetical protein